MHPTEPAYVVTYADIKNALKQFVIEARYGRDTVLRSRLEIMPNREICLVVDTWVSGVLDYSHQNMSLSALDRTVELRRAFELWKNA